MACSRLISDFRCDSSLSRNQYWGCTCGNTGYVPWGRCWFCLLPFLGTYKETRLSTLVYLVVIRQTVWYTLGGLRTHVGIHVSFMMWALALCTVMFVSSPLKDSSQISGGATGTGFAIAETPGRYAGQPVVGLLAPLPSALGFILCSVMIMRAISTHFPRLSFTAILIG